VSDRPGSATDIHVDLALGTFASATNNLQAHLKGDDKKRIGLVGVLSTDAGKLFNHALAARDSLVRQAGETIVALRKDLRAVAVAARTPTDREYRLVADEARQAAMDSQADWSRSVDKFNSVERQAADAWKRLFASDVLVPLGVFGKRRVAYKAYLIAFQYLESVAYERQWVLFESGRVVKAGYLVEQEKWGDSLCDVGTGS